MPEFSEVLPDIQGGTDKALTPRTPGMTNQGSTNKALTPTDEPRLHSSFGTLNSFESVADNRIHQHHLANGQLWLEHRRKRSFGFNRGRHNAKQTAAICFPMSDSQTSSHGSCGGQANSSDIPRVS